MTTKRKNKPKGKKAKQERELEEKDLQKIGGGATHTKTPALSEEDLKHISGGAAFQQIAKPRENK